MKTENLTICSGCSFKKSPSSCLSHRFRRFLTAALPTFRLNINPIWDFEEAGAKSASMLTSIHEAAKILFPRSLRYKKSEFLLIDLNGLLTTNLYREFLTSLSTSTAKNFLPVFSFHTNSEAMCSFPAFFDGWYVLFIVISLKWQN
jgi:hypothetical protein